MRRTPVLVFIASTLVGCVYDDTCANGAMRDEVTGFCTFGELDAERPVMDASAEDASEPFDSGDSLDAGGELDAGDLDAGFDGSFDSGPGAIDAGMLCGATACAFECCAGVACCDPSETCCGAGVCCPSGTRCMSGVCMSKDAGIDAG